MWSKTEIEGVVSHVFPGIALRPGQASVIESILASPGDDIICTFPTGYGKSLCYIAPVLALGQGCIVVSPLCSLIQASFSENSDLNILLAKQRGRERILLNTHKRNLGSAFSQD